MRFQSNGDQQNDEIYTNKCTLQSYTDQLTKLDIMYEYDPLFSYQTVVEKKTAKRGLNDVSQFSFFSSQGKRNQLNLAAKIREKENEKL